MVLLTYAANESKLRKILTMMTKVHSLNHTTNHFMSAINLLIEKVGSAT